MPKTSESFRWLRLSATALLLFGGLGALYFFSYVSSKKADYADRSFRALSTVAEDFVGRLTQVQSTLRQVSGKASALREECARLQSASCSDSIGNTIYSTIALTPGLRPEQGTDFDPSRLLKRANGLAIHIDPISGRLRYRYRGSPNAAELYASAALGDQIDATHLRNLFDEVLVATEQGDVVYREGGGFGLTDLSTLVTTKGEPLRLDSVRGASRSVEVDLGGKAQHLFLHPFLIPFSAVIGGIDADGVRLADELLLVGLVRSAHVSATSRQLPSTFVLILFALVMCGILAAPFLKIWFLGESERFGIRDVTLLVGASFIGAALTTFAFLDLAAYTSMRSQLDAESDSLASEILNDLAWELKAAREQLTEFFQHDSLILGKVGQGSDDEVQIWKAPTRYFYPARYPYLEMMFWADSTGMQRQKWTVRRESTPRVRIADRRYYRTARLPALAIPTLGAPNEHEILDDSQRDRFAFELIQSRTTGQSLLAVSVPLEGLDGESSHVSGSVGGLVTQPISLAAPVLPMGMRFAFVEGDGRIALTSDLRQRRENLLQECGNDRLLASALAARRAEEMTVRCYGAEWRFYLKPVGDQPYSLVMMRDLTLLGALNFEVLMTGLVFYCLPLVIILTGLGVLFLLVPSAVPSWIWPDARRSPAYFQAATVAVAAGAFLVIGEGLALTGVTLQLMIVLPALVFCMVILIVGRDPNSSYRGVGSHVPSVLGVASGLSIAVAGDAIGVGIVAGVTLAVLASSRAHTAVFSKAARWGESGLRVGYAGLPVWLLLSFGVGAPYILFQDAFDHAMESWTRASQLHSVQAELEHDRRAAERYSGSGLALPPEVGPEPLGVYRSVFFQEAGQRCQDIHEHGEHGLCGTDSAFMETGVSTVVRVARLDEVRWPDSNTNSIGLAGLTQRHFTGLISAHAPVHNPAIERTRRIAIDRLEDNRWQWSLPSRDHTLLFRYDIANTDSLIQVVSTIPRWSWINLRPYTIMLAVVAAVIGAIVFGLSHNIMRLVFGLDLETEVTLDYGERIDLNLRENRLLIGPPRDTIEWLANHPDTHYVDLTREITDSDRTTDAPIVVLDHFDYKLDAPKRATLRFQLVSHLIFVQRKRVVLISGLDPIYYLGEVLPTIRSQEREEPEPTVEEWAGLLSKFQKGRFSPTTRSATRKSRRSVRLLRGSVFDVPVRKSFDARREHLSSILEEECEDDLNLKRYADEIRDHELFPTLTERQVIAMLSELAEAYYRTLWGTCSVGERLLLFRLAKHAFVNPKTWNAARRLKQRGLIEKDPAVRLKNESFRQFILQAEKPATIAAWQEQHAVGPWSKLRSPLLFTAVVVGVFFFFTQRDQLNASMAFITSFAAAIPAVIRLLSLTVGQGRSAGGSSG